MNASGFQLTEAVRALEGLPVLEWRNGYGDSGSLHLGKFINERSAHPERSARERGEVIVTVWGASVRLESVGSRDEPTTHPPVELRALELNGLVGDTIARASWSSATGELSLHFASGSALMILPDADAPVDADQWVIESRAKRTFIVRPGPRVVVEA